MSEEHVPAGAVERLMADMTVGALKTVRKRDANQEKIKLREIELQFQYEVSGVTSGQVPEFIGGVKVDFPYPFYYAPSQRESTLQFPHFTFGSHTNPPVGFHATVTSWNKDPDNGAIIGAEVKFAAVGEEGTNFQGWVHLTFQGFSSILENEATGVDG